MDCGCALSPDSDTGLASRWIHGGCLGLRMRIVTGMASRFGHGSRFAMDSRRVSWTAGAHCHRIRTRVSLRDGFTEGVLGCGCALSPAWRRDSDTGLASRWIRGGCLGLRVRIVTGMASSLWILGQHSQRALIANTGFENQVRRQSPNFMKRFPKGSVLNVCWSILWGVLAGGMQAGGPSFN